MGCTLDLVDFRFAINKETVRNGKVLHRFGRPKMMVRSVRKEGCVVEECVCFPPFIVAVVVVVFSFFAVRPSWHKFIWSFLDRYECANSRCNLEDRRSIPQLTRLRLIILFVFVFVFFAILLLDEWYVLDEGR